MAAAARTSTQKGASFSWEALLAWGLLALVLVAADQWLKDWIQHRLIVGDSEKITSFFSLVVAYNSGAAFSFLADAGGWQKPLFIGLAVIVSAVICFLIGKNSRRPLFCLSLALILGGAVGNALDRSLLGVVVDYLDFYIGSWHWPAFNFADICICSGAFLLIVEEFFFPTK